MKFIDLIKQQLIAGKSLGVLIKNICPDSKLEYSRAEIIEMFDKEIATYGDRLSGPAKAALSLAWTQRWDFITSDLAANNFNPKQIIEFKQGYGKLMRDDRAALNKLPISNNAQLRRKTKPNHLQ